MNREMDVLVAEVKEPLDQLRNDVYQLVREQENKVVNSDRTANAAMENAVSEINTYW